MRTTKTGTPAADSLQVQRSVIIDTIVDCTDRRRAVYLPAADIGHIGRHYGHELGVGFERQSRHVDDAAGQRARRSCATRLRPGPCRSGRKDLLD